MPVISFEGSTLTTEQKSALMKEFTDAAVRIIPGIPKEAYYVFINDHDPETIGVGGVPLPEYLAQTKR